jgi:ABC-type nitrate/sulfonate/bicarbonate transport system ATPase subunit
MTVENISKIIDTESGFGIKLFENISFEIVENAITSIIAPVGSGKTSLLKILAGLDKSSETSKSIPESVYIPAEASSFPWLNVTDNIKFGKTDIEKELIKNLCFLVGLEGYENHFPNNKSIGFRFRICLARSLAVNPKIILLDEPFSKMDHQTKLETYQLMLDINTKLGTTFLLATTNLSEAVLLSNRIHLMNHKPLELLKSLSCNLDDKDVFDRLKSQKYSKCLLAIEDLIKSAQDQQLFTISI